jgi:hypothetical protein
LTGWVFDAVFFSVTVPAIQKPSRSGSMTGARAEMPRTLNLDSPAFVRKGR